MKIQKQTSMDTASTVSSEMSQSSTSSFLRKRNRSKREEVVPPLTYAYDKACSSSLSTSSSKNTSSSSDCLGTSSSGSKNKFQGAYEPEPVINQSSILAVGIFIFVLAAIWPPLILLFAYVASKLVPYSFRVNDTATARRQLFAEFAALEDLPESFKNVPDHIHLQESYWVNARGMALCTITMTPKHMPVKAVVCYMHGYTDTVSFMKQVEYQRFVNQGIAFCAIEVEGHGRSDGPCCLINDWELMIDDTSSYFREVALQRFPGKPIFLMGESMGGAVAYSTYNRIPNLIRGVVFCAPMCKISQDMLPPDWVISSLTWLIGQPAGGTTSLLGYLPIAPAKQSLGDVAHKIRSKLDLIYRDPLNYGRNPRLATARELIRATRAISSSLQDFTAPFLIVHGLADRATDPALSQALYDESKSTDKTIRLYEGMYHGLTSTEPDENIDRVFGDAIEWILARL